MEPNTLILQNGTVDPNFDCKHDRIDNVVYYSMDWFCPTFNGQLRDRIKVNWGNLTTENLISDVIPSTNTGNLHIAIYDYSAESIYVAFARKSSVDEGSLYAYNRSWTRLILTSDEKQGLFDELNPIDTNSGAEANYLQKNVCWLIVILFKI